MSDICKSLNLSLESIRHSCITVEEREHMDATFMLLSLVHLFLKDTGSGEAQGHVILVLFQNNFQHLNNIGMKLFMNLKSLIQSKKMTIIELFSEESSARDKFSSINNTIGGINADEKLIVFSNLNHLTYMGNPPSDVLGFASYIKNVFSESTCILHCTNIKQDTTITTLNNALHHLSSYVIQVSNLKTGFCREISGHIQVSNKYKMYNKVHHFLFTNRGVNVFLPGGLSTR